MSNKTLDELGLELTMNEKNEPVLHSVVPFNPYAFLKVGSEMCLKGNHTEGIETLKRALDSYLTKKTALVNLANAYMDIKEYDKALDYARQCQAIDNTDAFLHQTFCKIYTRMGKLIEAEKHLMLSEALDPKNETTASLRIELIGYSNKFEEYTKALGKNKEAVLYFGLHPFCLSLVRRFPNSPDLLTIFGNSNKIIESPVFIYEYKIFEQVGHVFVPWTPPNKWDGSSLDGKTVLLYSEQGLGDNIWLLGLVNQLKTLYPSCRIKFAAYHDLHCVVNQLLYIDEVLLPGFDSRELVNVDYIMNIYQLMEHLPFKYEKYLDIIPSVELPSSEKQRVIINWISAKHLSSMKKINMQDLATLLKSYENCDFYIPQRTDLIEEIQIDIEQYDLPVKFLPCKDILELCSYIKESDCIITVDTLHMHIAGAMDKPCFCLLGEEVSLPFWGIGMDKAPYYNSVRAIFDIKKLMVNSKDLDQYLTIE
jgi:ADP-heptose:LPS heptosyltransferase